MKKYRAIQRDNQNKVKEHFIIYRVAKKGKEYYFCFCHLDHVGFMSERATELNRLIENAIVDNPQVKYFKYTGSHFEPDTNRLWAKLPWQEIKND